MLERLLKYLRGEEEFPEPNEGKLTKKQLKILKRNMKSDQRAIQENVHRANYDEAFGPGAYDETRRKMQVFSEILRTHGKEGWDKLYGF